MVHQQDAATHSSNPASGDAGAAAHPFWQSEQITNRVDPYSTFAWELAGAVPYVPRRPSEGHIASTASTISVHVRGLRARRRWPRCMNRTPRSRPRSRRPCENVRVKRPLVPATDIDDGWSRWRTSGTESGRGSGVLAIVVRTVGRVPTGTDSVGRRLLRPLRWRLIMN